VKYILELEKILKHYRKILPLSKLKSTPTKRISKNEERIVYALTTAQEKMRFSIPAMKRFFEKFLESGKESINSISSAVENGDLKTVYEQTHALKSVAFSLNLDEIGTLCETLEYGAKEKKLINYRELSKKLDNLFKELELLKEAILLRFDNLI
jgi:HPt (histidine-containing phosphotransfer) domain-containing protein